MSSFLGHLLPLFFLQLDQAENSFEDFLTEITTFKLFKTVVIILITYSILLVAEHASNWLSERVARRFRLMIKQAVPFWKALILLSSLIYLINLLFDLSEGKLFALTGTLALALGFAFKDYVSSIIAGAVALFEAPYRVGDRVRICGHYGEVTGYGLRGIRIQTPDDNLVTIPHSVTWNEPIANANAGKLEAQVVTDFFFRHDVDSDRVLQVLYQAAYSSKYTQLKLPVLVVIQEEMWGTRFKLKCYPMDAREEFVYQTDLIRRAKRAFAHMDIAYPSFSGINEAGTPSQPHPPEN